MWRIRNSFAARYAISLLHCAECKIYPLLLSDEKAVLRHYRRSSGGEELDIQNPVTFSQKVQWYKLNARLPLMQQCADKVTVREYVKEKGYSDLLNEQYGVYEKVREINYEDLPNRFVLKAAHGSGMNIIVKDKSKITKWGGYNRNSYCTAGCIRTLLGADANGCIRICPSAS